MNYIPLNVKTHYELLSSLIKVNDLVDFLCVNKISAVGITDSNMFGSMEFLNSCVKHNIKPIIGVYFKIEEYKLFLYAKNYEGYVNLLNLVSERNVNTLTKEFLMTHKDNLIIVTKDYDNYDLYKELDPVVYLSYENIEEKKHAMVLTDKIVYIKENTYIEEKDKEYIEYLKMIKEGKTIENFERLNIDNYLNRNIDEYDAKTTFDFAKNINIVLPEFSFKLPEYCIDKENYLRTLANKGLSKRLNEKISQEYIDRLNKELDVIINMNFTDYFLIVYDFILYAKKNKIVVGPGRGSAAGSLVSYCLGITEIDPIKYNLIFERFLNPERITMPDIDTDIEYLRRDEVINYVKNKYGSDRVSNIITFGTLLSKQVLRDVGRVLLIDNSKIDKLVKTISDKETFLDLENNEYFNNLVNSDIEYQKLVRISKKLEGLKRHTSTHAAGVVISDEPLMNKVPLYKSSNIINTGYTMEYLEQIGLLKMDFLAIKNLTIIDTIIKKIKEERNLYIDINKIPLNDYKTLNIFYNAETIGIFQFESEGMMAFLKSLKVRSFDDLVSAIALYRPGPRDNIPDFIKVREGKKKPFYIIPELEEIIKDTNGIIVYQEQILEILKQIGGFSYSTADNIRRAMSKKKEDIILKYRNEFVCGAMKNGVNESKAREIYDLVLKFANYGFNKSHSVAYSLVAYQMAFLKAHFKEYYMITQLDMVIGNEIKTKEYIDEAKLFNLNIEGVDINLSKNNYTYKNNKIYLPLTVVKNIGKETVNNILSEREKGKFTDYFDFLRRVYSSKTNIKAIENLIIAGALDSFDLTRKTMIENIKNGLEYAKLCNEIDESLVIKPELIMYSEYDDNYILNKQYEMLGFYLNNHPVTKYKRDNVCLLKDIEKYFDKVINSVAMIESIKEIETKNKDKMAFLTVSDEYSKVSLVLFPLTYKMIFALQKGDVVKFTGRVEKRMSTFQIVVNKIEKI